MSLPFTSGQHERRRLGGAGRGRDDVDRGGTATLPVLLGRAVDGLLRGGVGVDRGHQAFLDAEAFLEQHVHDRREAVRGAGGVGNDVVLRGIVFVVVHAHDDRDVLALARSGDDDLLARRRSRWPLAFSASVKRPVDSMTMSTPRSFQGIAGVLADDETLDLVAVDDQHVVSSALADDFFWTAPLNAPWVESYFSR